MRKRLFRKPPPGSMPGTVSAPEGAQPTIIEVTGYGPVGSDTMALTSTLQLTDLLSQHAVVWVNISGLANVKFIDEVLHFFEVHNLAREDMFNLHQRPKVEDYRTHLFLIIHMISEGARIFEQEQISFVIGEKWVITLQERPGDCLAPVRTRIANNLGQIRQKGAPYLAYALVDAMIDQYFPIAESVAQQVERLEADILEGEGTTAFFPIHNLKGRVQALYQLVWSHKETLSQLIRPAAGHVDDEVRVYFRDCLDHTFQLLDYLGSQRESLKGLLQLNLAIQSQRSNEIMKFLTIVASIFIPLTFIVGLYGMNFDPEKSPYNMPELTWRFGYFYVLGAMVLSAGGLLAYFYKQGWFSGSRNTQRQHFLSQNEANPQ